MKFIHLTDTHFVPPGRLLFELDPKERLAPAIADINRHHGDAAFVLVTGDLAHMGEREAYVSLRDSLGGLDIPYRLIVGNHDHRQTFLDVFPETPSSPDGFIHYTFDTVAGRFVMIDSIEPGTHEGILCRNRLDWIADTLATSKDGPVYLCLHHSPVAIGIPNLDEISLRQSDEFAEILAPYENIRHIFFGHVHRPVHGAWQGIPFSTLRATNHQTVLSFDRNEGILACHEPPAYAIVRIDDNGDVVINVHDYADDSPRFYLSGPKAVAGADPLEAVKADETMLDGH